MADILDASPSAVKLYVAMQQLSGGGDAPFAAVITTLCEMTGQSFPTVVRARHELITMKLIVAAGTSGHFRVPASSIKNLDPRGIKNLNVKNFDPRSTPARNGLKRIADLPGIKNLAPSLGSSPPRLSNEKEKEKKNPVARVKIFNGVSLEERRVAVKRACKALGIPETARYVQIAMAKLARLLQDGVTVDDAVLVARYCRTRYDAGDRFLRRINLIHVWSAGEFPVLLGEARRPAPGLVAHGTVAQRERWSEAHHQKLAERGLA